MRLLSRFIILISFLVLVASCSTAYQIRQIDVLRPASYMLPDDVHSVVLVNNTLPYRAVGNNIIEMGLRSSVIDSVFYDEMPVEIIKALQNELLNRGYFDYVYIDTISHKNYSDRRHTLLDSRDVSTTAMVYNADAVLSLDDYSYGSVIQLNQPEYGSYCALMAAYSKMLWRFNAPGNVDAGTFEVQNDTLFWSGDGISPELSVREMPSYDFAMSNLSSYAGAKFANLITPYWERVPRLIFNSGNSYFIEASNWASKNNWVEASKLWNFVFVNGKQGEQARAAANIALAMEMQGSVDDAAKWCAISIDKYESLKSKNQQREKEIVVSYFNTLLLRQKEVERLNKQMRE